MRSRVKGVTFRNIDSMLKGRQSDRRGVIIISCGYILLLRHETEGRVGGGRESTISLVVQRARCCNHRHRRHKLENNNNKKKKKLRTKKEQTFPLHTHRERGKAWERHQVFFGTITNARTNERANAAAVLLVLHHFLIP